MFENDRNDLDSQLTEADLLQWIEVETHKQYNVARMLVDDYWRMFKRGQKENRRFKQGRIGVRIRTREKSLSFSIEWFRISSIMINGKNKTIAEYVRKGAGFSYPLGRLLQNEPGWEATLVEEYEPEFAKIRKSMDALGKIRDRVKFYSKLMEENKLD
jgi:hypothetical protein